MTRIPRTVTAAIAALLLAAPASARAQAETDLSAAEIDALLARLADPGDLNVRSAALVALLEAQAGVLPLLTDRLFRPNGITAGLQQRLLEDYVRRLPAELPAESPVPRRTSLAPLLHLLVLSPHETYRESWAAALQAVGLLAALDAIDTNDALMEAIRFVSRYDGAYARAVGLLVRAKGDRAIPALVLSRKIQDGNVKSFVADQLARMGKERAPLMAQVNDDQLLADILRAIAEVRDSEGVNVMLSFINSDRPFVRQAARESLLLYERNAIWPVRKAYEDITGERAETGWDWRETMDRLFAAQDAARLEPLDRLLSRGLAAAADARFEEMDSAFGSILGREPKYPRRAEMVRGLLAYGEQLLSSGDVLEARRVLRLAGYLVPEGDARAARIAAHLAYLEGLRRRDLGFPDAEPFREAARLDPAYAKLVAARGDLADAPPEPVPSTAGQPALSPSKGPPPHRSTAPPLHRSPPDADRSSTGRIAVAAGIVLTAIAGLFLLISSGRLPGRLFGAKGTRERPQPEGRSPAPEEQRVPGGMGRQGLPATPARDAEDPPPAGPSPDQRQSSSPVGAPRSSPEPQAEAGECAREVGRIMDVAVGELHADPAPAEQPPAPDPYARIAAALARIRTDVPGEEPAGEDGTETRRDRRPDGREGGS
ncbi:MAG: hypothetical protein HY907_05550 [Deltaproteobacteria bacterium]|nr:hypothetical protein [Deltaproteobacteria bacterium]